MSSVWTFSASTLYKWQMQAPHKLLPQRSGILITWFASKGHRHMK